MSEHESKQGFGKKPQPEQNLDARLFLAGCEKLWLIAILIL